MAKSQQRRTHDLTVTKVGNTLIATCRACAAQYISDASMGRIPRGVGGYCPGPQLVTPWA
jgi:hypothetical protein